MVRPLWKSVWRFLKNLETDQPHDPAISPSDTHPKDSISYYSGTCCFMLIAALLTVARKWKQPRCPSTDEWINL